MKFLKPSFWSKALVGIFLLAEFIGFIVFFIWLVDWASSTNNGAYLSLVVTLIFVGDVVVDIFILNNKSTTNYKLIWMFFVLAIPVVGIALYIFFANKSNGPLQRRYYKKVSSPISQNPSSALEQMDKKTPHFSPIAHYLDSTPRFGVHQQTSCAYFPLGDDAFPVLIEELKKAKHYIFMEYFIVEKGIFWDAIEEVLVAKAASGVDVRFMYDDVGSITTVPASFCADLNKKGVQTRRYNRFRPLIDVRLNNRDHRKITVIDGHTAFSGGYNLADEYINRKVRFGHWRDNGILLKGKAVENFTYMFLANWRISFDPFMNVDKDYYSSKTFIEEIGGYPKNEGFVAPYGDLPYDNESVGETVYRAILSRAKKYVYITTPYLILGEGMEHDLITAAKSGIDVRLLLPHIPDKKAVFHLARSYYGPLMEAGVKVYEYTPGFVHEKTFICDDEVATVGTINLDYRSLYLHMECGTLIVGDPVIADIKKDYLQGLEVSHEVSKEEWEGWHRRNKTYWALLRIVGPAL